MLCPFVGELRSQGLSMPVVPKLPRLLGWHFNRVSWKIKCVYLTRKLQSGRFTLNHTKVETCGALFVFLKSIKRVALTIILH